MNTNPLIYIINPENDLALAFGGENYTAPPLADILRSDLQMLPYWYAEDGSYIVSTQEANHEWLKERANIIGKECKLIDPNKIQNYENRFVLWGWSADARKRLIDKCVKPYRLPVVESVKKIRELSHRRSSIFIMNELSRRLDKTFNPLPKELDNFQDIRAFSIENPICYIKAPWSSSGKGVFRVLDPDAIDFERWSSGILKRQGSILCEVRLDKILDFAIEFCAKEGKVNFAGYSVFENDSHSSFNCGIVAAGGYLRNKITSLLKDDELLDNIINNLEEILTEMIGVSYEGYLGIDMMLYEEDGNIKICPCVELNLRMTMGMVTSILGNQYLYSGRIGEYYVEYFKKHSDLVDFVNYEKLNRPAKFRDKKMYSGTHFLTPIYSDSQYCAYVTIKD